MKNEKPGKQVNEDVQDQLDIMHGNYETEYAEGSNQREIYWDTVKSAQSPWSAVNRTKRGKTFEAALYPFRVKAGTRRKEGVEVIVVKFYGTVYVHALNSRLDKFQGKTIASSDMVRCIGYEIVKENGTKKLKYVRKCPMCEAGLTKWPKPPMKVLVVGILDNQVDQFNEGDYDTKFKKWVPRLALLKDDDAISAYADAIQSAHDEEPDSAFPERGLHFEITRSSKQMSAGIGTWGYLGKYKKEINYSKKGGYYYFDDAKDKPIFYSIDLSKAFPLLNGQSSDVFPKEEHEDIIDRLLTRHVQICNKTRSSARYLGYDPDYIGARLGEDIIVDDDDDDDDEDDDKPRKPKKHKSTSVKFDKRRTVDEDDDDEDEEDEEETKPRQSKSKPKPSKSRRVVEEDDDDDGEDEPVDEESDAEDDGDEDDEPKTLSSRKRPVKEEDDEDDEDDEEDEKPKVAPKGKPAKKKPAREEEDEDEDDEEEHDSKADTKKGAEETDSGDGEEAEDNVGTPKSKLDTYYALVWSFVDNIGTPLDKACSQLRDMCPTVTDEEIAYIKDKINKEKTRGKVLKDTGRDSAGAESKTKKKGKK